MGACFVVVEFSVLHGAVVGAEIFYCVSIHGGCLIASDKYGFRTDVAGGRVDRSNEGQRGNDDFVSSLNAAYDGGEVQSGASAGTGSDSGNVHIGGDARLKIVDPGSAGGYPCAVQGVIHVFFFISAEIRYGKRNKAAHIVFSDQRMYWPTL